MLPEIALSGTRDEEPGRLGTMTESRCVIHGTQREVTPTLKWVGSGRQRDC